MLSCSLGRLFDALHVQNKDSTGAEKLSAKALGDYYTKMTEDFPIVSIEDAFDQVWNSSMPATARKCQKKYGLRRET